MEKTKLQTLKGFRDFLPEEAKKRAWVKDKMVKVAEKWGYEPIETPTLESYSLFEGEIGEDEKLFYKFKDLGGRDVMLRYDQTVPTCRFVAANRNSLTFPFRRYQCQPNFRAEKPQRGRYREFTQFDIDIFGVAEASADAEIMAENIDTYLTIGFKKPVIIFNNRDLMKDVPYEAISSIDKLKKIGKDGVIKDMEKKGITKEKAEKYYDTVQNIKPDKTIETIINYLENYGYGSEFYRFEPTLARSFSYSQGPIWEIVIEDYDAGSVGGGERYDGLMNRLTGLDIPATGIAYGFDRTVEAADQLNLIPPFAGNAKVLVTVFEPKLLPKSLKTAKSIRNAGISTEVYPNIDTKLDKQLKYADKRGVKYAVIIGPEEVEKGNFIIKDLKSRTQQTVDLDNLIKRLSS